MVIVPPRSAPSALEIDISADRDGVRLPLRGALSGDNADLLTSAVEALADGDQRVTIDLRAIDALEMPGVRALIELGRAMMPMRRVEVVNASRANYELLDRTGVRRLLPVTRG